MTAEQEHYLISILDKSEEDLLFEIARGTTLGITASAGRPQYETKSVNGRAERIRKLLNQVPTGPVSEHSKSSLEPFLADAQKQVQTMHMRLYKQLCDPNKQEPTVWALDVVTGQKKDIIVAVVSLVTTQYNVAMSVAIPVVVYLLKKGLNKFCATNVTE